MKLITVMIVESKFLEKLERSLASIINQTRTPDAVYFILDNDDHKSRSILDKIITETPNFFKDIKFIERIENNKNIEVLNYLSDSLIFAPNSLVHFLSPDVNIYPNFYETHEFLHYIRNPPLTVSQTLLFDTVLENFNKISYPFEVNNSKEKYFSIDFNYLVSSLFSLNSDWFGGFSTIVWNTSTFDSIVSPRVGGIFLNSNSNLNALIRACIKNPCGYINTQLATREAALDLSNLPLDKREFLDLISIIMGSYSDCSISINELDKFMRNGLQAFHRHFPNDLVLSKFVDQVYTSLNDRGLVDLYILFKQKLLEYWRNVNDGLITTYTANKNIDNNDIKIIIDIPLNTITYFNQRNKNKGLTYEWLSYRIKLFFEMSLGSLLAQTSSDFLCVIHYLPESELIVNSILSTLSELPENIVFSSRGDEMIESSIKDYKYIYKLRLDSDNIIHPNFVEQLKRTSYRPGLECIIARKGFVYEISTNRLARWNHNSSAFNAYVYKTSEYDSKTCLPSWEPEFHMSAVNLNHNFLYVESQTCRSYLILVHGGNLQNEFQEIMESEHFAGLIEDKKEKEALLREFYIKYEL